MQESELRKISIIVTAVGVLFSVITWLLAQIILHIRENRKYKRDLHMKYKFYLAIIHDFVDKLDINTNLIGDLANQLEVNNFKFVKKEMCGYERDELSKMNKDVLYSYISQCSMDRDFIVPFKSLMDGIFTALKNIELSDILYQEYQSKRTNAIAEISLPLEKVDTLILDFCFFKSKNPSSTKLYFGLESIKKTFSSTGPDNYTTIDTAHKYFLDLLDYYDNNESFILSLIESDRKRAIDILNHAMNGEAACRALKEINGYYREQIESCKESLKLSKTSIIDNLKSFDYVLLSPHYFPRIRDYISYYFNWMRSNFSSYYDKFKYSHCDTFYNYDPNKKQL